MKTTRLIGLSILFVAAVLANHRAVADEPTVVDKTNPVAVVEAIFTAARTGEFAPLAELCDRLGQNDGDTRRICILGDPDLPADRFREEFKTYFAKGRVNGEAVITGDSAKVPFLFGPDGTKREEMNLVKRGGKWYLKSF